MRCDRPIRSAKSHLRSRYRVRRGMCFVIVNLFLDCRNRLSCTFPLLKKGVDDLLKEARLLAK